MCLNLTKTKIMVASKDNNINNRYYGNNVQIQRVSQTISYLGTDLNEIWDIPREIITGIEKEPERPPTERLECDMK